MWELPRLKTERLLLRPFTLADAKDVQRLAGDRDIASTTASIPHPYDDGVAEQWIAMHQQRFEEGTWLNLAITCDPEGALVSTLAIFPATG